MMKEARDDTEFTCISLASTAHQWKWATNPFASV